MDSGTAPDTLARPPRLRAGGKDGMFLPVYDVTPFTLLDFPGKTACIIWFSGCNMRCGYCHNPQIVRGKGTRSIESIFGFLKRRAGLLDGVVLSGGEATLYTGIVDFADEIKRMGFSVKLDTNGSRPKVIQTLLAHGSLDYVALDYKSPLQATRRVTGVGCSGEIDTTLRLLMGQSKAGFEIRTTVHTGILQEADIAEIIRDLEKRGYGGKYYIQNFISDDDRPTLGRLPPQPRPLDLRQLPRTDQFEILFRNF
ncbi:MAG TPA: anaerobic ribonucleoside-triphosphate reductase activating protein [Rhodospirillaceae bacterium]|nr:anaerobic ribonucleoside-triphosphate reductase activating protein [Rhodospirillaceae bacterium]